MAARITYRTALDDPLYAELRRDEALQLLRRLRRFGFVYRATLQRNGITLGEWVARGATLRVHKSVFLLVKAEER